MDAEYSTNPYQHTLPPFAGRQAELTRIDQYIKDAQTTSALVFIGQRGHGKTALLQRFDMAFDEQFLGIHVSLADLESPTDAALIQTMVRGCERLLTYRDVTVSRLPQPDPTPDDWRVWFAEVWLPEICQIIRPHRRLVVLMDDAHRWLDDRNLPDDRFVYFHQSMTDYPQFKLIMTFPAEREDELHKLTPLVDNAQVFRLNRLTSDEVRWILTQPVMGRYALSDAAISAAFRTTGGHPWLVQRLAAQLYDYQETHTQLVNITPEIMKQIHSAIYLTSSPDLERWWTESSETEQVVLMALSNLHYANPLRALDAAAISDWLIDTDYPLDRTTVNAALRSLEYRELLSHQATGVELTSGLFQTWLLEHARQGLGTPGSQRWRSSLVILAVIAVIIVLGALIMLSNAPQTNVTFETPNPTVTLEN